MIYTRIVHGLAVLQRYHTEISVQLRNENPVSNSIIFLNVTVLRFFQCAFTPLSAQVGTFPQHLFLEVSRRLHKAPE